MPLPPGIEQLPSGNYRGRYTGPDGRRHTTKAYPSIEKASHALNVARGDVARGDWVDPQRSGITLDQWFALWMPRRQRIRPYVLDKEWARYRNHIQPRLGQYPLHKITVFAIQTWHGQLKTAGRKPATIAKAHALLKTALGPRGAMGDERIRTNPAQLAHPDPVPKPQWRLITQAEFDQRLSKVTDEQAKCLITLAVFTGLRWSEIAGLTRADYNPLRHEVTVRRGLVQHHGRLIEGPTKTGKERTVPLVPRAADALAAHIAANPMPANSRLFTAVRGGPLRHDHFTHHIYRPAFPGIRFHDLRHSCASWLLNAGVPPHVVMEIMGWASITTMQRYAHTDRETLRDTMRRALEA